MHSAAEHNNPQQLEWPGLSSNGVIVEQLRQADPYAPAQPGQQQHDGKPHVAFHLAITSCDSRRGWARLLSNTLLSVMASEVHPTTITVIWCRTWPGVGKEPSLFANWRLSSRIKVWEGVERAGHAAHTCGQMARTPASATQRTRARLSAVSSVNHGVQP